MQNSLQDAKEVIDANRDERNALAFFAERSQALLKNLDASESMVEPMAKSAIEMDRANLAMMGVIVKVIVDLEEQDLDGTSLLWDNAHADALDKVIDSANIGQRKINESSIGIAAILKSTSLPGVKALAREVLDSLTRIFNRVETSRWAALERQADLDIEQGKVREFGNASAAVAHLKRVAR